MQLRNAYGHDIMVMFSKDIYLLGIIGKTFINEI